MTYLQLVNSVLTRMRESQVATVASSNYSLLIGHFINDAKKRVEDSFNWNALRTTITVPTVATITNYVLTNSGTRFKVESVVNNTQDAEMINVPISWIIKNQMLGSTSTGNAAYYAFNGVDSNGDTKVEVYPTPNTVDSLVFTFYKPQADLSDDADVLTIQSEAVIAGAYALALAERGEDQGLMTSEAQQLYRMILADSIAIESGRYCENEIWIAT